MEHWHIHQPLTPIIIWENGIIECNYVSVSRQYRTRLWSEVSVLHSMQLENQNLQVITLNVIRVCAVSDHQPQVIQQDIEWKKQSLLVYFILTHIVILMQRRIRKSERHWRLNIEKIKKSGLFGFRNQFRFHVLTFNYKNNHCFYSVSVFKYVYIKQQFIFLFFIFSL